MSEASFTSVHDERKQRHTVSDLREWTMQQRAVGRCLFCPKWVVKGSVEEVEELSRAHRAANHPDLPTKPRRARANLARWRTKLPEEYSEEIANERKTRMRLLGIPDTE